MPVLFLERAFVFHSGITTVPLSCELAVCNVEQVSILGSSLILRFELKPGFLLFKLAV